jgi:hypothetical protein
MEKIHYAQKDWLMDKKESFHIYMYNEQDKVINEQ